MPRIERDGVGIHYEVAGNGPAVLLSHGYSATCRMWDAQVAALQDRYRVVTWDMRGHGQSNYPEDGAQYSEQHTVADMAAILREVDETRAVIGGLSLGGVMSLAFHLRHPETTRALMLFDTGPGFKNDNARAEWNARAMQRAADLESRGTAALGARAETRAKEHRNASGLARAARGMLTQSGDHLINSLPTIRVPTLVLVGSEDANFLAATDYMARKIQGAEKVVIQGAGHAANLDQPAAFNDAVQSFLGGLAA